MLPRLVDRMRGWATRPAVQVAALVLLVLLVYWNSLDASFHFDDYFALTHPYVIGPGFGLNYRDLPPNRQFTYLTFHWNYLVGGTHPQSYHWVNLLLHAANAILVWLIARRHLAQFPAWLAAALFAVHPLQTEAVTFVYQRAIVLATFFALLSFFLFLQERYLWSVGAFVLSLLSKVETGALPVFFLLYDLFVRRRRPRFSYYALMLGLPSLGAARLLYLFNNPQSTIGFKMEDLSLLTYVLTQARVVWMYLRLVLFPVGLNLDHDVALSQGVLSPPSTLLALLALAFLVGIVVWLAWRGTQPAFWVLGFFVLLAPSSSVIPLRDVMVEHRMYFPLISLFVAAAWLLARLPVSQLVRGLVVAFLVVALSAATIARNQVWQDGVSLWSDVVQKSPQKKRGYINLGKAHAAQGYQLLTQDKPEEAVHHFEQASALLGESADLSNNTGAAYLRLRKVVPAEESFRHALELDPCYFKARKNLALMLRAIKRTEEALRVSEAPPGCHFQPEQNRELGDIRRSLNLE